MVCRTPMYPRMVETLAYNANIFSPKGWYKKNAFLEKEVTNHREPCKNLS